MPSSCELRCDAHAGKAYVSAAISGTSHTIAVIDEEQAPFVDGLRRKLVAGTLLPPLDERDISWESYANLSLAALATLLDDGTWAVRDHVYASFRGRLDRRILDTMRVSRSDATEFYNWLNASGDVGASLNRRQAVEAYPLVAGTFEDADTTQAIDNARPLVPPLAQALRTSEPCIRALQGILPEAVGGLPWLRQHLPMLASVPPRNLPNPSAPVPASEQWAAAFDMAAAWSAVCPDRTRSNAAAVSSRMAREAPVWQRSDGRARCSRLYTKSQDAWDFVSQFTSHVIMPVLLDASPFTPAQTVTHLLGYSQWEGPHMRRLIDLCLVRERGLAEVIALSRRWHRDYEVIAASLATGLPPDEITWAPLTPPHVVSAGGDAIEVIPLCTAADLAEEGRTLGHCVGSYTIPCLRSPIHILSLRQGDARLSTVEITLSESTDQEPDGVMRVRQHYGRGNAEPPALASHALEAYLGAVASGVVAFDPASLELARQERLLTTSVNDATRLIGYDWLDPQARDRALDLYGFALPEAERGLTHAAWAESIGLDAAARRCLSDRIADESHYALRRDVGEAAWKVALGSIRDEAEPSLPPRP